MAIFLTPGEGSTNFSNIPDPALAFLNLLTGNAGIPVIFSSLTAYSNGGAGVSTDLNSVTSSGTTPSHGLGPSTGTTSTGGCGAYLTPNFVSWLQNRGRQTIQSYRRFSLSTLIRIPTLSDGTDTFTVFVGGYEDVSGFANRSFLGALIQGSTVSAAGINNGVVTLSAANTTIAANTWTKVTVSWDGTTLSVSLNSQPPLTLSSGLVLTALAFGVTIVKTAGTNNRNVNVANTPTFIGWTALP